MTVQTLNVDNIKATAGRVAVLMGGPSAEREISLESGRAVCAALLRSGIDAHDIDWNGDLLPALHELLPDRVFVALHGRGGEDGKVQGLLEVMGIPYTGSDVLGCALSMDKVRTKLIWQSAGLATPPFSVYRRNDVRGENLGRLDYPLMVKPASEGSSLGANRVTARAELDGAIDDALRYDDTVILERWITGGEYTLGILAGDALPLIKLETPNDFYDYDAKYLSDSTRYLCPCGLPPSAITACEKLGIAAFEALGARGWGRVDFMLDDAQRPWLIELNTVPGMTDHSLVPMAAAASGIDFDELCLRILATSLEGADVR